MASKAVRALAGLRSPELAIASSGAAPSRPAREVFAVPAFRRYWLAQLFASISHGSTRFVFVWLALDLSDSAAAAGVAGIALGIPQLLMMVPLGAVADRMDRRLMLVWAQLAAAVVFVLAAVSVWTDVVNLPLECVLAIAAGTLLAAIMPTLQSLPPFLVPKERLMTASALQGLGMNTAILLGPAIGGITIAIAGVGGAFAVLAVLEVAAAVAMSRVMLDERAAPLERRSVRRDIADGIRYTSAHEPLRSLVGVAWVVGVAWSVMFILVPETSRDVLGQGALGTAMLFTAAGTGLLLMSILLASRQPARPGRIIAVALTVVFAGGVLAIGLSRSYPLTWIIMFVCGLGVGVAMPLQRGLLQRHTRTELMGRVMAISSLGLLGSFPIAAGLSAILSASVGPADGLVIVGVVTVVAAGAVCVRAPLRNA